MDTTTGYTPQGNTPEHPAGMMRIPYADGYRIGLEAIVPANDVPPTIEVESKVTRARYRYALARVVEPISPYDHCLTYVQVQAVVEDEDNPWKRD